MAKKRGQNEGTIYKLPNGTWSARITVGKHPNGNQKRKAFYGKTRAEVQKKMISALNELNNGTYVEPSNLTVSAWFDTWLLEYKKNSIKLTTFINYRARVNTHIKPAIGNLKLKDLRTDIIQKMVNELIDKGFSPETVKGIYNTVHSALKQAVYNNLIQQNVASNVLLPKTEKRPARILSMEEQNRFVEVARNVYRGDVFILGLGTGLRIGELLALTWNDINFDDDILRVNRTLNVVKNYDDLEAKWYKTFGSPKTESSVRSVPLLPNLVALLKEIKRQQVEQRLKLGEIYENHNLVFGTRNGRPLDPRNMQRTFASILKKAGLEPGIHIHSLRHTFATRGLENGIELRVMQELLGHSSIKMTANLYTHVLPDKKKASIMKLKDTLIF